MQRQANILVVEDDADIL